MPHRVIGIDLGGTRLKAGLIDGDALTQVLIEPLNDRDPAAIVLALTALVQRLDPNGQAPVGLAAAGVMDAAAGLVRESPNLPLWHDVPLGRLLAASTGRRVTLDNDANAVILGEARYGVARGRTSLIGYTLGTGVGGALILDGRLYRGTRGMAGELGHVTVEPEGRPCGCGNRGCLERYAGQRGLHASALAQPALQPHLGEARDTPELLASLAPAPSPAGLAARAVLERAGRYLGQAAAAAVHTLDVTTLVLAGGIAGAFDWLAPALLLELRARTFRAMSDGVEVLRGELDTHAGLLGAAALARDDTRLAGLAR